MTDAWAGNPMQQYRSGHNEHDWKSCGRQKRPESSNLSCCARKREAPQTGCLSFSAQEEIRIEDRQPPGAAGSSGPVRTTRRRRGRHIVRGDFLQKSPLTHFVAAPLQIEPAALGFDLVLGAAADYRHRAPVFHRSSKIILFPCFCAYRSVVYAPPKSRHIIAIK